jgi:hypothetical protein
MVQSRAWLSSWPSRHPGSSAGTVRRAPPCILPTSLGELAWRVRRAGPSIEAEPVAVVAFPRLINWPQTGT